MGKILNTKSNLELLNYIMNQDPVLTEGLDLPSQAEQVPEYGKLILNVTRKRNAFVNTVNLIALTLIVDNDWENPWEEFTEQGRIAFGQTVREIYSDLVEAQDYNQYMLNPTHFLETQVPNLYNYFHDINFQKFYKVSINDVEMGMAFLTEEGLYDLINRIKANLYTSYKYDKYLIDKYMLQRRIIDGTIPSVSITNFDNNTVRQNVALMKEQSNNMIFMSPNYNPAGVRKAVSFENQRLIMSTGFEAQVSTEVLATSYFKNDAEFKTKSALIDGFGTNDWDRLARLIGSSFVAFTEAEISKLQNVVGCIIESGDRRKSFYKDFYYAMNTDSDTKETEFYNPEQLTKHMWLHTWRICSTSPFAGCVCFSKEPSSVVSVTVTPSVATVTKGQNIQLKANVVTGGITNKAVAWTLSSSDGVRITPEGILYVDSNSSLESVTVTATSIYDNTKTGTATITIV